MTFPTSIPNRSEPFNDRPLEDDLVLGWTLTAEAIERFVSQEIEIIPGSVEISRVSPGNLTNTTLFRVRDRNGSPVIGRIEVRIAADEKKITVRPCVRVLGWVQ